jgi:hypothetical protein
MKRPKRTWWDTYWELFGYTPRGDQCCFAAQASLMQWREDIEIPYSAFRALAIASSIERGDIIMYLLIGFTAANAVVDVAKLGRIPNWVWQTMGFLLIYCLRVAWILQ